MAPLTETKITPGTYLFEGDLTVPNVVPLKYRMDKAWCDCWPKVPRIANDFGLLMAIDTYFPEVALVERKDHDTESPIYRWMMTIPFEVITEITAEQIVTCITTTQEDKYPNVFHGFADVPQMKADINDMESDIKTKIEDMEIQMQSTMSGKIEKMHTEFSKINDVQQKIEKMDEY